MPARVITLSPVLLLLLTACPTVPGGVDAGTPDGGSGDAGSCGEAARPLCCVGSCGNDVVADAVCAGGQWACPEGAVSCPAGTCTLPPPDSQATYTYPGCPEVDGACPRMGTVLCALETLRLQSAACTTVADCVQASVTGGCTGYGLCAPAFVNVAHKAEFETAAAVEIDRYCPESGGCMQECNPVPNPVAQCVNGMCSFRVGP